MAFFVYIVKCKDATLYIGTTNDLTKRVHAHNFLKSGAKYTRSRRPVSLVYSEKCGSVGSARKREAALKRLTRSEKLALVSRTKQRS